MNEAAKKAFQELPKDIKKQFGTDLQAVQNGERPFSERTNIKEGVGPSAIELIEWKPCYRAVYCAKYENTVFVLHAFTKTTNGVDRKAMKTAKERYKEMLKIIKERKQGGR
ncbi:conserved hypothetical protein [Mesorhizobium plurifarium]|uniref:Phage-related protein n=1 Tax=Mesorhizobium plurifarium TaxID=69974 RepID=A0A090GDL8_MESPL|nr:conserved hypothetical protein [Mesorhizobium plurifarium]